MFYKYFKLIQLILCKSNIFKLRKQQPWFSEMLWWVGARCNIGHGPLFFNLISDLKIQIFTLIILTLDFGYVFQKYEGFQAYQHEIQKIPGHVQKSGGGGKPPPHIGNLSIFFTLLLKKSSLSIINYPQYLSSALRNHRKDYQGQKSSTSCLSSPWSSAGGPSPCLVCCRGPPWQLSPCGRA